MIDFKKYSDPEIEGNIADAMSAPQRAATRILKWGLAFAACSVFAGILIITFSEQRNAAIVSSICIFLLTFVCGCCYGAIPFPKNMNKSLQSVLDYGKRVMQLVINDVGQSANSQETGCEIFSGVMTDIINPAVKKGLGGEKITIVGRFVFKIYSMVISVFFAGFKDFLANVDVEISEAVDSYIEVVKGFVRKIYLFASVTTIGLAIASTFVIHSLARSLISSAL